MLLDGTEQIRQKEREVAAELLAAQQNGGASLFLNGATPFTASMPIGNTLQQPAVTAANGSTTLPQLQLLQQIAQLRAANGTTAGAISPNSLNSYLHTLTNAQQQQQQQQQNATANNGGMQQLLVNYLLLRQQQQQQQATAAVAAVTSASALQQQLAAVQTQQSLLGQLFVTPPANNGTGSAQISPMMQQQVWILGLIVVK